MDKRPLAALLSSLISQLLLILFAVSPPAGDSSGSVTPLLLHFLSSSQTAASLSLLSHLSNKRKRSHLPEPADPPSKLGRRHSGAGSPIPRNPDAFTLTFKMTSSTFEWLSALLEPLLECRDPVNSPLNLTVESRLGIGLFRVATGSDYPEISRRFGVTEPIAKFCVKQFCRVLCTNFRFWVGFPNPSELKSITKSIESLTGFPNCCGVLHSTRFKILKSVAVEEEAIAAQMVVDSSSRILSVAAGFNCQKGKSNILKKSTLYKDIESKNVLDSPAIDINGVSIPQYLIGDKGYPFLPWLMVPFDQPVVDSHEETFNFAHNLMCVWGIRTAESLKNWGVLSKPINEEIKTLVAYIGACSILHNAMLMREDFSALSANSDDYFKSIDSSFGDDSFKENSVEPKAFEIRSALATRARRC